jgi:threonine dehydratase
MSHAVELPDVAAAARRIVGSAWRTPLVPSVWLSQITGADVWLKLETVQATGSFKIRGAANAVARLKEINPSIGGVTTASTGNHGLALATAGRRFGVSVRVHLPAGTPDAKRQSLARLGAEMIDAPNYDAAEAAAQDDVRRTGTTFVSAYSHPDVIAGAGTAALEMLEERPDLDTFVVPVGGGGLLSGTAVVVRALVQGATIIGAEADASPVFTGALAAGRPVTVDVQPTLADGLAGNMEPDSPTFDVVRDLVDRVLLVRESVIAGAMRGLILEDRLVGEGAAATAVGALLQGDLDLRGRRVGVILSGRNVAGRVLRRVLSEGDD